MPDRNAASAAPAHGTDSVDASGVELLDPEIPMLGPAKPRRLDQPIAVSLRTSFRRTTSTAIWRPARSSFVRDWTRELYADRGRPSIDPVVFFKLQLVMFFEGIRSERQLIETAS